MTASSSDVCLTGRRVVGDGDDRPRHHLTGRVIGDVPTAIGVDNDGVQRLRRDQEMFFHRPYATRVRRRVLEDQYVVVARLQQGTLEVVRLRKRDSPEVATSQHSALAFDVESGE